MPNSKKLLKIVFALSVWSLLVIGLLKMHGHSTIIQYFWANPKNTDDVIIDDLAGKWNAIFRKLNYYYYTQNPKTHNPKAQNRKA